MNDATKRLPTAHVNEFCSGFYGYGDWNAPWWFLGMEERGCASYSEAERRLSIWREQKSELADLHQFHHSLGIDLTKIRLPVTWRFLLRLMLSASHGGLIDKQSVLQTLVTEWGVLRGPTCLVELQPLPCPNRGAWPWREWCEIENGKPDYERRILRLRLAALAERRQRYKPRIVVLYGRGFEAYWQQIVGCELPKIMEPDVRGGKADGTVFLSIPHLCSRKKGMSYDLMRRLGEWVRDTLKIEAKA